MNEQAATIILLVEDSNGDVLLFQEAIRELPEKVVLRLAKSVDEGIALLSPAAGGEHAPPPSLIVLDLHLPGKDGKSLLKHINDQPHLRSIPVVMLSSSTRQRDIEACFELGARHYRVKPRDWQGFSELIAFLRQFWDPNRTSAAT